MALIPGTRLGPYEVASQIGFGGMGEVYRATETNLGRDVAIKVLPDAFAQDPERLARFEREARALATLNHPNIAQIYGLERREGQEGQERSTTALVMELVDGPTLADRIARGPIAVHEALLIAKQIAEALEAAHEQGIIHRDLKPANVKVRPDGTVKVLDFGLAKLVGTGESRGAIASGRTRQDSLAQGFSPALTNSPTMTTPAMTQAGVRSRDGKTLFFRRMGTGEFVATPVTTESTFAFGTPQQRPVTFAERQSNSWRSESRHHTRWPLHRRGDCGTRSDHHHSANRCRAELVYRAEAASAAPIGRTLTSRLGPGYSIRSSARCRFSSAS